MEIVALGKTQASLAGTTTVYVSMQVRTYADGHLRLQGLTGGQKWEHEVTVSHELGKWISERDHTRKSVVSTTPYVPCLVKCEDGTENKVRVQIAGPARNREFGVVFLLTDSVLYNHAKYGGAA